MSRAPRHRFPSPCLITTTEELEAACRRLRPGDRTGDNAGHFVTVDTEFIRERTYWPELCVVQLGGEDEVAVIDALAPGLDLTALGELLADPAVTKVFHAARQDVEIFNLKFGVVPHPLFDTQVAAMVAGFGDQVGYEALVGGLTDGSIDKAHQRYADFGQVRPRLARPDPPTPQRRRRPHLARDRHRRSCARGWTPTDAWRGWRRRWRC